MRADPSEECDLVDDPELRAALEAIGLPEEIAAAARAVHTGPAKTRL
jgi:hypothetical protein